jgi:nucleoside-diphosphate-sugar epimerase
MARLAAVTGATGFVGGPVVAALDRAGWRLRLLVRRQPPRLLLANQTPEVTIGDLADEAALARLVEGADAVVHVAGAVKALDRTAFMRANAEPVGRVAALAARQPKPPHFLLMSSLAAREPTLSAYGASKRAGEDALKAAAGDAMPWTILRPTAVYGPGDRELLPFFKAVRCGLAPRPAGPARRLSLIHIADLAEAVAVFAGRPAAHGQCWELDDGAADGHGWDELALAAGAAFGTRPWPVTVPMVALRTVAQWNALRARLDKRPRMLVPGKVAEMAHFDWRCHDRPPPEVGTDWQPRWRIGPGFAETIAWYRARSWL